MKKLFKWEKGRQENCEYSKFTLWYFRIGNFGFDAYILRYEPLALLPIHKDIVENADHYRLNINLKGKNYFALEKCDAFGYCKWQELNNKIVLFRPDLHNHYVCIGNNSVTKLSLGFVKFK